MTETPVMSPGKDVCLALNNAHTEWKKWDNVGKKFIYFEHHCDVYFGCTFVYDYNNRTFHSWRVTDEEKYMMFLLRWV